MKKEEILEAYNFRHACKVFDESKQISAEDFNFILETARLSPSSFGMEHWRFLIVENKELRAKIKSAAWNQAQISTASHLVVVLTKTEKVTDDTYINTMFSRRGLNKEAQEGYIERYKGYIARFVERFVKRYFYKRFTKSYPVFEWSARQCYIAAANMTTSAAMIGIDSCFIEGFSKEDVEKILDIDTTKEDVALILAFGYRLNPQPAKFRLSQNEIVEYIK